MGVRYGTNSLGDQALAFTFTHPSQSCFGTESVTIGDFLCQPSRFPEQWGNQTDEETDTIPDRGHCEATGNWRPLLANLNIGHTVLGSSGLAVGVVGWGILWEPALYCSWPQVEDAVNQTSQTLQLLIEHDPVSQRLDQLRLDARLSPHMQNTRHSHTLSTLDTKENLEGTLRRRSLRCHLLLHFCPMSIFFRS